MFDIFSTCPASVDTTGNYRDEVIRVARWSEAYGHRGLLIYTDNTLADPWLVADAMIDGTATIVPLVAVQPMYSHPYVVAKTISSIALMRGRRVALNLVTGGFARHLVELGDPLADEHDRRYDRLLDYTAIIRRLLAGESVTATGFYRLRGIRLQPPVAADLRPDYYLSGGSPAAADVATRLGVPRLSYAGPPAELGGGDQACADGIRIGILARDRSELAWKEARTRFPPDPVGQRTQELAGRATQSSWHADLSRRASRGAGPDSPYWLFPFRIYKTFCPYLVGSYDEVAEMLADYHAVGIRTIILDTPRCVDDVAHADVAFARCYTRLASASASSSTSASAATSAPPSVPASVASAASAANSSASR